MYEGEIRRIDAGFERLWQKRKAEIEQKWDKALWSTKKEWVDYNPSLDVRSYVNFDEGFVEISAIVPESEKNNIGHGKKLIADQIKKVFSKENASVQNLLEGQVFLKQGKVVSPDTLYLFIEKTKKKSIVEDKPFKAKDGVPRIKVKVRFNLLPGHLQIRAKKYYNLVNKFSKKFGLSPQLIMSVIHTESYFNPMAVSPANAHGLMQLIPEYGARDAYHMVYKTDRIVSAEYLHVPENNIRLGSAYLSLLENNSFKQVKNELSKRYLAICAYNWGPGSVKRKIIKKNRVENMTPFNLYRILKGQTPKETSNYLRRVTKRMKLYEKLFD